LVTIAQDKINIGYRTRAATTTKRKQVLVTIAQDKINIGYRTRAATKLVRK